MREAFEGDVVFGVRPEHVALSDSGAYRGEVQAAEYLGTTQIVTLDTHAGVLKARDLRRSARVARRDGGAHIQRVHRHAL